MNSSKPKLVIKNLSKSFKESQLQVLDNISLTVNEGELVSIIGPSGCGKSTLLDCVAGLTDYDGEIYNDGGAAYMFQDDVMFPWRNVLANVTLPLELAGVKKETAKKEATKLLKTFGLAEFSSFSPFMLSGGMRERASLLRTYVCKKDVMLLDEPFSKLDALNRMRMQEWFLWILHKHKKAVLFVTHDIDEAILLSDRIYLVSPRPAKIVAEIPVPIKKPRTTDVLTSSTVVTIKKQIMKQLTSVQQ
jgi:ABC-type nitrate/sulfonate/bicarbonate transport system ATPase subunit